MPIDSRSYDFTKKNVDLAPEEHGVYALYDRGELIYYGRAAGENVTIRSRLQDHLSGSDGKRTKSATHYAREVTGNPEAREKQLLEEYQAAHVRLPRCNERVG